MVNRVPRNEQTLQVYFIRCGQFVKIGRAYDPEARLSSMRSGNPFDLTLVKLVSAVWGDEQKFHARFAAHHHRDEWYRYEGALAAFLESDEAVE